MSDENQSTVDETRQAAPGKNIGERAEEAKQNYEKSKTALNVAKFLNISTAWIAPVISVIAIIILIIFFVGGFVGFFITLPGLAMEKIKNTSKNFIKWAIGYEGVEVSSGEINSLADYINDMGYDIVGYGFARSDQVKTKKNESTGKEEFDGIFTDEELKDEDSVTTSVSKSNLYAYILASERTYCTDNTQFNWAWKGLEIYSGLDPVVRIVTDVASQILSKRYTAWNGMLVFDDFGDKEKLTVKVTVDRANEKLIIDTGIGNKQRMTWNTSDWTSKYGKPIELSLAWHLSTMAPDFVYNFCMDNDLQTKIRLGTNKIDITNIKYKYQKEGGEPVTSDEVLEIYEKYDKDNRNYIITKLRLFPSENDIALDTFENDSEFYAPVDIFTNTSIISIKDTSNNTKKYYKAVDENKNPISFEFDNLNDLSKVKFNINFNENDEPYFELNQNGNFNITDFLDFKYADTGIDIGNNKIISLEVLSFNDLKKFVANPPFEDEQGNQLTEIGIQQFKGKTSSDWPQFKFLSSDAYANTMSQLDSYIKKIVDKKDELDIENLTLKHCDNIKNNEFTEWSINSDEKYKGHNAKEIWNDIKKDSTKDNFETLINNFSTWINDETTELKNNNTEIEYMLVGKVRELLEKGNLTYEEFTKLVTIFQGWVDHIESYEPYIKTVTNHWRTDLYFETDEWSSYKETVGKYYGGEFEGNSIISQDLVDELSENGTFFYSGTSNNSITQEYDPQIVTTAPWHYKMKNWVKYGYYFIYDGNQSTAKEIEKAKEFLSKKENAGDPTYDSSNPLLLAKYKTAKSGETQKDLYYSSDIKEIDNVAQKLNDRLKNAGYNVRLQHISFDKDASLTAFSILESVHTEDADYIYEELKKFLIELEYFTSEDFEKIETDVFEWLIPDYKVYKDEWPDSKYERLDTEYGAYIRSKLSLDTQKEREKEENKDEDDETEDTETNKVAEAIQTSSGVVYEENTDPELHCDSTTTINGIRYCNYKQGYSEWANDKFSFEVMASAGCGPTSCAVILSGYGKKETPVDTAAYLEANYIPDQDTAVSSLVATLNHFGVSVHSSSGSAEEIRKAWSEGKPVIYNTGPGEITDNGHYFVVLGEVDEGVIVSQVGGNNYGYLTNNYKYNGTLETLMSKNPLKQIIVPDEAPDGVNFSSSSSILPEVVGYESGLDIIMPETGKIIEIGKVKENTKNESQESKTSEDTTSEDTTDSSNTEVTTNPNDNSRSDYIVTKGDYILIEFETDNGVNGWKMRIEGFDLDTVNVQEGVTLQKGDVIGITNEYNMKLILYDTQDAIMNNIQDYFVLQERDRRTRSNISNNQYEFFYFVIYESGVLTAEGNGPESVGACRPGIEHGVGICQWTSTTDGLSNIQKVCENLYNLDNDLCKPLQKYIGMDSVTLINQYAMQPSFENSILKQDFQSICERDRERFLELQMQIAMEEKYEIFEDLGLSWVRERPLAVQGTLASLVNWGAACGWENVINQSMSDEDIIINLLRHACTIPSTVGYLNSRWNPQAKAAIDILHGEIDAERFCKEIEYSAPYSTGTNGDFLSTQ